MNITTRIEALRNVGLTDSMIKAQLKREKFDKAQIEAELPTSASNELNAHDVMRFIIDNRNVYASGKKLATAMFEAGLCSEKTGYHIVSLMKFVDAYHELMSE